MVLGTSADLARYCAEEALSAYPVSEHEMPIGSHRPNDDRFDYRVFPDRLPVTRCF